MDRETLMHFLEQTKRRVADNEHNIALQKTFIYERMHDGRPTAEAKTFLRTLEDIQAMHIARRDRLESELGKLLTTGTPDEVSDSAGIEIPVQTDRK